MSTAESQPLAPLIEAVKAAQSWFLAEPVSYLLIGGIAASILGRPRMTRDVDAVVWEGKVIEPRGGLWSHPLQCKAYGADNITVCEVAWRLHSLYAPLSRAYNLRGRFGPAPAGEWPSQGGTVNQVRP